MASLISSSWRGWDTPNIASNPVGFVRLSGANDAQLANDNSTAFHVFVGTSRANLPANATAVPDQQDNEATKHAIRQAFADLIDKNQKVVKTSDLLQQIPRALAKSNIKSVGELATALALVPAKAPATGVVYKMFSAADLAAEAVELLRKLKVTAGENHSIAVYEKPSPDMMGTIANTTGRWIVLVTPAKFKAMAELAKFNPNVVLCVANGGVSQAHAILDGIDYFNYQPRLSSNSQLSLTDLIDQLVAVL